jgi:hypothetical protein
MELVVNAIMDVVVWSWSPGLAEACSSMFNQLERRKAAIRSRRWKDTQF